MLQGFLKGLFFQKWVLCLSGGKSTDVIMVANIFLAQGLDKLRRRKLQPCDLVVLASSRVSWRSCQGPRRRGGYESRCWRPSGLCPSWMAPECSLLASGKRGCGHRDSACGIQVPSRRYRCAGLRCTLLRQADGKKHSWLTKSFRADEAESWPELEKGCACCKLIAMLRAEASGGMALGCCTPSCDLSWCQFPISYPHREHGCLITTEKKPQIIFLTQGTRLEK